MITHKEVKRFLNNFDYWLNEATSDLVCEYLTKYITQQEKKDKLLELYRKAHIDVLNGELAEEIKALEEELK